MSLHQRLRSFSSARVRDGMVLVLAWAAGYLDAVSYTGLGHVFTANMTGNTILMALAVARPEGRQVLRSGMALIGYVIGVAGASFIVEKEEGKVLWPASVTRALSVEFAIFLILSFGGKPEGIQLYSLIVLAGCVMGIQSTAIHALGLSGLATTYITGTWTNFIRRLSLRLQGRRNLDPSGQWTFPKEDLWVMGGSLTVYVLGAVSGAITEIHWGLLSLLWPSLATAMVILTALGAFHDLF